MFGVALRWPTYARTLYLLLSFPISMATWIALVVLLSLGGGLAITVVGVPLLLVTMYLWCIHADLERLFSNTLFQTRIRPLPFGNERGLKWPWERLRARLTNRYTWRTLAFLLLVRFPMGVAGFTWATLIIGTVFQLLSTPFDLLFGIETQAFGWVLDAWWEAAVCVVVGLVLVIPGLHLLNLGGQICGRITEWCLQSPETDVPQPWGEALDRAAIGGGDVAGGRSLAFSTGARATRGAALSTGFAGGGKDALLVWMLISPSLVKRRLSANALPRSRPTCYL